MMEIVCLAIFRGTNRHKKSVLLRVLPEYWAIKQALEGRTARHPDESGGVLRTVLYVALYR